MPFAIKGNSHKATNAASPYQSVKAAQSTLNELAAHLTAGGRVKSGALRLLRKDGHEEIDRLCRFYQWFSKGQKERTLEYFKNLFSKASAMLGHEEGGEIIDKLNQYTFKNNTLKVADFVSLVNILKSVVNNRAEKRQKEINAVGRDRDKLIAVLESYPELTDPFSDSLIESQRNHLLETYGLLNKKYSWEGITVEKIKGILDLKDKVTAVGQDRAKLIAILESHPELTNPRRDSLIEYQRDRLLWNYGLLKPDSDASGITAAMIRGVLDLKEEVTAVGQDRDKFIAILKSHPELTSPYSNSLVKYQRDRLLWHYGLLRPGSDARGLTVNDITDSKNLELTDAITAVGEDRAKLLHVLDTYPELAKPDSNALIQYQRDRLLRNYGLLDPNSRATGASIETMKTTLELKEKITAAQAGKRDEFFKLLATYPELTNSNSHEMVKDQRDRLLENYGILGPLNPDDRSIKSNPAQGLTAEDVNAVLEFGSILAAINKIKEKPDNTITQAKRTYFQNRLSYVYDKAQKAIQRNDVQIKENKKLSDKTMISATINHSKEASSKKLNQQEREDREITSEKRKDLEKRLSNTDWARKTTITTLEKQLTSSDLKRAEEGARLKLLNSKNSSYKDAKEKLDTRLKEHQNRMADLNRPILEDQKRLDDLKKKLKEKVKGQLETQLERSILSPDEVQKIEQAIAKIKGDITPNEKGRVVSRIGLAEIEGYIQKYIQEDLTGQAKVIEINQSLKEIKDLEEKIRIAQRNVATEAAPEFSQITTEIKKLDATKPHHLPGQDEAPAGVLIMERTTYSVLEDIASRKDDLIDEIKKLASRRDS